MDQAVRNRLRNVVTQCRRLLEDATAQALQGRFGIYAAGRKDDVHVEDDARMGHLTDEDRALRHDLLDHLEHIKAVGLKPREALEQLVREIAFTHLNRLCAYKMMEARGLIREAVSRGLKSQGFFFYLADHPKDEKLHKAGQQDAAYRHFLDWLGGTLSEEIGVLFNPNDPANRLYPPQRVLDEVLGLINGDDLAGIWTEDETIGWVYQYFTPKELRDKARKESQAPRNSYELAFRNQFYTPRYVVEFLTDNTLGRIWYEMRKGETILKDRCRYLVRRPTEIFLKEGEKAPPEAKESRDDLSQEELLKLPVYIPHRPKKDPREIKILDPACGSGHFLLYCFDLLQVIYEEAWEEQWAVVSGQWSVGSGQGSAGSGQSPVGGGQWSVGSGQKAEHSEGNQPNESAELQGPGRLAKGDGPCSSGVPADQCLSEGRDLRADGADAPCCRLGSVQHRGGTGPQLDQGLSQLPGDGLRLAPGGRDAGASCPEAEVPGRERDGLTAESGGGSGSSAQRSVVLALKAIGYDYDAVTTDHRPLITDFPTKESLRREVPRLILKHNLHGIDIDLRATQIAALALWLRCQRAYWELGLKNSERPKITRSNIVCAEPMPGETDLLGEFTATLQPRVLGQLVETIFEKMKLAGEAGSLLKIDEEIRQAACNTKAEFIAWKKHQEKTKEYLFPDMVKRDQPNLFDFADMTDEAFLDRVEEEIVEALRRYATQAENGRGFRRRLFAEDAARGFAFVDLCRKRYDVVLMNPPFGEAAKASRALIERSFPRTKNDVYAAFVERGLRLLHPGGRLGAITSRTGFFLSSFTKWREEILLKEAKPTVFADLGYGVMDSAMVEAAAYCLEAQK